MTERETGWFRTPLVFFSEGVALAGCAYRNVDNLSDRQLGVVVTGSWLTVKEQMAERYAVELARRGYTAFTFDFTGFGESRGEPRQLELPDRKIKDMIAAVNFLSTCAFVQPEGVGYLAICASSQYALWAIARGAPIAAFASVAGWHHDAKTVAGFYGGPEGVRQRIGRAREAFDHYSKTGDVRMVPAYREGDESAGMFFQLDYYSNPDRGAVSTWRNEMAETSWLYWLTFDGLSPAEHVKIPVLMVHGDACALPDNARAVHARLENAELLWSDGSQQDFYDQPAYVEKAVAAVDAHFARFLRGVAVTDRSDIVNCITVLLQAVDLRDWTAARACLADEVDTDYSSLFGGTPERLRSDALIKRWRDLVPGFDSTQHIAGPVLIYEARGDSAKARTAVRAYHYFAEAPGGSVWIVAGRYEMRLSRLSGEWRISALTLQTAYQDGNLALPGLATKRAQEQA
jgi:uncharacterized protein